MRTALLVVEIVVVLAALVSGSMLVWRARRTEGERPDSDRRRVLMNLAIIDGILLLMAIAAWATYQEQAWGRTISVVAGALMVGALALRPEVAGKNRWAPLVGAVLGVAVVVLAFLLPSGG